MWLGSVIQHGEDYGISHNSIVEELIIDFHVNDANETNN